MEGAIGFVVFAVVAGVLYLRMLKRRRELLPEQAEKPRVSRRMQRQLEKVREFDQYEPEVPTLEELIAAEVAETGVDDLPGHGGLDTAVKLKVYHRDEAVHDGCRDRGLHFAVRDGVHARGRHGRRRLARVRRRRPRRP